ncbi:uncharacterized protein YmfQ (DUF2313 family) [Methylobacterium brachiatum]|jgi:uncharacterized protein YmfQ (DUF2313 family)|uniref:Uncharacterized protein YmfQ (DUF2313 family) n=1 Tax=Methylobacterium brachiatum TaxID=269660 RepID=A0AAJ1WV78_9HYPH|nr:putative phage tail protein [Methylobacterium brachiatum]MCB4803513.1 DUF2313 domain-containing protein [Methylobacterium brachiatum]MDQ0541950.1 uncharacterized protein YmfQ (DUF2313 family) [Methylobacterium brachiatum]
MADPFVRRSADDYAEAFQDLHPVGPAWPRAEAPASDDTAPRGDDEALSDLTRGLAKVWGNKVDARAADLLFIETDPRQTYELLTDWERAFGLPDPCSTEAPNLALRREALIRKLTMVGRQDRQFFIDLAAGLGYQIRIYEYRPVVCGETRCGDTRPAGRLVYTYARCGSARCGVDPILKIDLSGGDDWVWRLGAPNIRFIWRVSILNTALRWQRGGVAECGVDHHCEFGLATDLECVIRRLAPAHTQVLFDYSQVAIGNG